MSSVKIITIFIFLSLFLALRFTSVNSSQPHYQDNQSVRFIATVREEPEIKKGKQRVRVQTPHGVPVTIILSALPLYQYGDRLRITGTLKRSDYEGRVFWLLYYPQVQIVGKEQNLFSQAAMGIKGKAKDIRHNYNYSY